MIGPGGLGGRPSAARRRSADPGLERLAQRGVRARRRRGWAAARCRSSSSTSQPWITGSRHCSALSPASSSSRSAWRRPAPRPPARPPRAVRSPRRCRRDGRGRGQHGVAQALGRGQVLAGAEPGGGAAQLAGLGPAGGAGGQGPRPRRPPLARARRRRTRPATARPGVLLVHQPRPPFPVPRSEIATLAWRPRAGDNAAGTTKELRNSGRVVGYLLGRADPARGDGRRARSQPSASARLLRPPPPETLEDLEALRAADRFPGSPTILRA